MDIKNLQKVWNQLSSVSASNKELGDKEILEILNKRTKSTIERIERNIRIGSVILFLIIVFLIINDFLVSPHLLHGIDQHLDIPVWLNVLDISVNSLIVILFVLFVFRYFQVKKSCVGVCDLRNTLIKIIRILTIYRRLFGLALIIFLFSSGSGFIAGLYEGITLHNVPGRNLPVVIFFGILVLAIITGGLFLFLRWGFRRLYGNYLDRLKLNLNELDELD